MKEEMTIKNQMLWRAALSSQISTSMSAYSLRKLMVQARNYFT